MIVLKHKYKQSCHALLRPLTLGLSIAISGTIVARAGIHPEMAREIHQLENGPMDHSDTIDVANFLYWYFLRLGYQYDFAQMPWSHREIASANQLAVQVLNKYKFSLDDMKAFGAYLERRFKVQVPIKELTEQKRTDYLEKLNQAMSEIGTQDGIDWFFKQVEKHMEKLGLGFSLMTYFDAKVKPNYPNDHELSMREIEMMRHATSYVFAIKSFDDIKKYLLDPLINHDVSIQNFINNLNTLSEEESLSYVLFSLDMVLWKLGYFLEFSAWPVRKIFPKSDTEINNFKKTESWRLSQEVFSLNANYKDILAISKAIQRKIGVEFITVKPAKEIPKDERLENLEILKDLMSEIKTKEGMQIIFNEIMRHTNAWSSRENVFKFKNSVFASYSDEPMSEEEKSLVNYTIHYIPCIHNRRDIVNVVNPSINPTPLDLLLRCHTIAFPVSQDEEVDKEAPKVECSIF